MGIPQPLLIPGDPLGSACSKSSNFFATFSMLDANFGAWSPSLSKSTRMTSCSHSEPYVNVKAKGQDSNSLNFPRKISHLDPFRFI